ncbi:MAG TPA: hypothetical protein VII42_08910, partial [Caulobacteraceae bacterium]
MSLLRLVAAGLLLALALSSPSWATEPAGDWLGTLAVTPALSLRIAVHIRKSPQGVYSATWDSVDQGVFDGSVANLMVTREALSFDIPSLNARYAAKWDAGAGRWTGQWAQVGKTFPLDLAPG